MSPWRAVVFGSLAALVGGCELLASSDVYQCSSDGDCTARGSAFAGTACVARACVSETVDATADATTHDARADAPAAVDAGDSSDAASDSPWGCLGQVVWPPQSATETVLWRNRYLQLSSKTPVVGLQVTACASLDPDCLNPLTTGTTDDAGYVNLTVPKWFQGFLSMPTAPASYPDMLPTLVMALPPPSQSADPDASVPLIATPVLASANDLNELLGVIGRQLPAADSGLGHLFGQAQDCLGNPVAGVSIQSATTVPNLTLPYYVGASGIPSVSAQQTGSSGECGFVDLPAGQDTISFVLFSQGAKVGQVPLFIRSGFITLAPLPPTP